MTENEISTIIVNIAYNIHKEYGPGLFESVYEEIFCYELKERGVNFIRQAAIPLFHKAVRMEVGFRADIIVEGKVVVEIKSIEALAPVHSKQVITYLKLTGLKLGILINFNVNLIKEGIHRIVNKL
ncbi:MAG: GxxExxY protein [Ferruginibacter sp.]